jgi:GST-like protein
MTNSSEYTPPKVWTWNYPNSGRFATINRPIAGPTHDKELPVGRQVASRKWWKLRAV